ncbi:MAG TPA: hypothetical protein VNT01_07195 [Symbiobacteriaceae bacterium]|nr:hypothetical protein [Symbiobacteriaceae bacterium]
MEYDERKRLAEQRAANAQTVTFVANQAADIVAAAEARADADPAWSDIAAAERVRRETLMEVAREEQRLATAMTLQTEWDGAVAAEERDVSQELLEIALAEERIAGELKALQTDDDYGPALLSEQAEWNGDLLRHVAETATDAEQKLQQRKKVR